MKSLTILFLISFLSLFNNMEAQVSGCTDPLSTNYNPEATVNDGSCLYDPTTIAPQSSDNLETTLVETSGLIYWKDKLWTHNDNTDINLYALDTLTGEILSKYELTGASNKDWEEISQDDEFIYVGDFGNNANGNRRDLKIYKVGKTSLVNNSPEIEVINFSYEDQNDFSGSGANQTDFDCEAFIVSSDHIYLFTKQWVSNQTKVYSLPKVAGTHTASLEHTYNVQGLITGATYLESKNLVALSGYSNVLEPFVYLLYDFIEDDFFNGNKRKIIVSLPFHQVEGITTKDGLKYYISNERFVRPPVANNAEKLHTLDLSPFLSEYLLDTNLGYLEEEFETKLLLYPNPVNEILKISPSSSFSIQNSDYWITNLSGQVVLKGNLHLDKSIYLGQINSGQYLLKFDKLQSQAYNFIKR